MVTGNAKDYSSHSAEAAALGFYFQSLYALYETLAEPHDDAAICLERLDDIEIRADGQPLLLQLKHSLASKPAAVTIASRHLWKTIKAWIDILPKVELTETRFQLVTVAPLGKGDVLESLLDESADRGELHDQLLKEAQRVVEEHRVAKELSISPLPHADRIAGCSAFARMCETKRKILIARIRVRPGVSNIKEISTNIAGLLVNFPPEMRAAICTRLIEWWDLQVVFTLCGKRQRYISKIEALEKISEIASEIERDELLPDFEMVSQPDDYEPDSMILKQIQLVGGRPSDVRVAVREEWRARAQRHKWCTQRLDMAVRIELYDGLLREAWRDKFDRMVEDCSDGDCALKQKHGHEMLRWSYDLAHKEVAPFASNWNATYYVRGSYQVLSIDLKVGWHPEFEKLLKQPDDNSA